MMKIDRLVINPVNGRKDERDGGVGTGVKMVAANVIVALIKERDGKNATEIDHLIALMKKRIRTLLTSSKVKYNPHRTCRLSTVITDVL